MGRLCSRPNRQAPFKQLARFAARYVPAPWSAKTPWRRAGRGPRAATQTHQRLFGRCSPAGGQGEVSSLVSRDDRKLSGAPTLPAQNAGPLARVRAHHPAELHLHHLVRRQFIPVTRRANLTTLAYARTPPPFLHTPAASSSVPSRARLLLAAQPIPCGPRGTTG